MTPSKLVAYGGVNTGILASLGELDCCNCECYEIM